ncbi:hypothetical protein JKP88DRAFT_293070 [Tribonema minus]|uniref:Uncharacterized protein n=1 Tax=Tribonema minus TaxID=303371 RepID=A0A835ZGQ2_9STRA|nr:hypothetical protein JKP88DRAFT_293070 [Tribonema minus]
MLCCWTTATLRACCGAYSQQTHLDCSTALIFGKAITPVNTRATTSGQPHEAVRLRIAAVIVAIRATASSRPRDHTFFCREVQWQLQRQVEVLDRRTNNGGGMSSQQARVAPPYVLQVCAKNNRLPREAWSLNKEVLASVREHTSCLARHSGTDTPTSALQAIIQDRRVVEMTLQGEFGPHPVCLPDTVQSLHILSDFAGRLETPEGLYSLHLHQMDNIHQVSKRTAAQLEELLAFMPTSLTHIVSNGDPLDLTGLEWTDEDQYVETGIPWPSGVRELELYNVNAPYTLPPSLRSLTLGFHIKSVPHIFPGWSFSLPRWFSTLPLPSSLESLRVHIGNQYCASARHCELPPLPDGLRNLHVDFDGVQSVTFVMGFGEFHMPHPLPSELRTLRLDARCWPSAGLHPLPQHLATITIDVANLQQLRSYANSIARSHFGADMQQALGLGLAAQQELPPPTFNVREGRRCLVVEGPMCTWRHAPLAGAAQT